MIFVTLEDKPYANMTIPGKVQSYMAVLNKELVRIEDVEKLLNKEFERLLGETRKNSSSLQRKTFAQNENT